MCCFVTAVLLVGPRRGASVWWLINPAYATNAFGSRIWAFLGWLFLPWTTLMMIAVYPGGIVGFDWILLGLGVFIDIASYVGGYRERERYLTGNRYPDPLREEDC